METDIAISFGTYYKYLMPKGLAQSLFKDKVINAVVTVFNDGELAVEFPDSIRGRHMFIFGDATHNFMELIMTIDAARRSSVKEITVVLPFFGYSRQDKKGNGRSCIGAAVISRTIQDLGANRIVTIDIHAEQIQGFVSIPFENLAGKHLFMDHMVETVEKHKDVVLCSPDAGGTVRVGRFANALDLPMVIMSKRRDKPGSVGSMQLIGEVKGKHVILIDDIIDTGGTLIKAVQLLKGEGAKSVECVITHPVLSKGAGRRLMEAGVHLTTSNTRNTVEDGDYNMKVIDSSRLLLHAILNIASDKSVMSNFS